MICFFIRNILSECTMTVIRELYGLVKFPGGRFIAQVYCCSSRRLHTVIRVPWDTGTVQGTLTAIVVCN